MNVAEIAVRITAALYSRSPYTIHAEKDAIAAAERLHAMMVKRGHIKSDTFDGEFMTDEMLDIEEAE